MQNDVLAPPDPYVLSDRLLTGDIIKPWIDTNGRLIRNTAINTSVRNLVLITAGQSNRANNDGAQYAPANSSVIDNFNICDGALYDCAGPLLGVDYAPTLGPGNIIPRVADTLITNGKFDRVIVVPIAVGASEVADWGSGGTLYNRPRVAMQRLAARGIVPGMPNVTFAFEWGQGESDGVYGTSQATYQTQFNQMKAVLLGAGFVGRIFVAVETMVAHTTYPAIKAAQAALVDGSTVFASGNLDLLTGANRQPDGTHFSTLGAGNAANLIYNAIAATGTPF
ncbi:sialate O-acetylesterase [Bradyrhizobium sp. LHD-71]|uniref:sialate O-acetylesterase n=1 Tax=Bradyrhizobium sp. LHD-71 TaxID=3072141 RepID=UPI00280E5778|nr:sialate O-acetylesterase [Bradyrhizobium sp. LHD-71]MDQ8730496.1 sialate O-acetylesterase [Bradyrhizobium sp. LHD-71]